MAATCSSCAKDDTGCVRAAAALEEERDPKLAGCLDAGASACLFGTARDRARAIATAVCGIPSP